MAVVVKNPPANAGDVRDSGLILEVGRYPERGHGNPLQYSCLENPMNWGAWQAMVHSIAKSQIWLMWLSTWIFPGDLGGKESAYNAEDMGLILRSGKSPGEGNVNPLQYFWLGNPMERGAWQAIQSMGLQRIGHNWGTNTFNILKESDLSTFSLTAIVYCLRTFSLHLEVLRILFYVIF